MTARLYYHDAGVRTFEATVMDGRDLAGRPGVVLDRTAFYPTSGGQPFDTGRIDDVPVVDVIDAGDEIVHVVTRPIPAGARVTGEIDWPRRFDHMQQHTGQHVLSAAFVRTCGAETVGFHMGAEVSTIDLSREVTAAEIAAAERAACAVVWDDRPVAVRIVPEADVAALALRKAPARSGDLRVVEIAGCDRSACGGTHVPRTGAIGLIVATGWERVRQGTRVSFVCGGRALAMAGAWRTAVSVVSRALSTTPDGFGVAIERLQRTARDADRSAGAAREALADLQAAAWRADAEVVAGVRLVARCDVDADTGVLARMARAVVTEPGFVAVLVGTARPRPVVVARSGDVALDAGAIVRAAAAALGGRGGGRPDFAQAGIDADGTEIVTNLRRALST